MKTTQEIAKKLDIKPSALRAHITAGNIERPQRRVGQSYLWSEEEEQAAVNALAIPGRRRSKWFRKALSNIGQS